MPSLSNFPSAASRHVRWLLAVCLLVAPGCRAQSDASPVMWQVKLLPSRQDDEASDLLATSPATRTREDRETFWTVLDELPVERALARLTLDGGRSMNGRVVPVEIERGPRNATEDGEALARLGEWVYVFGSHFGRKVGPLDPRRQWVARFPASGGRDGDSVRLQIVRDEFLLHRLLNDALQRSEAPPLLERGPREAEGYIRRALDALSDQDEATRARVRLDDRAINIEGAVFLDDGALLLGLRFPTTRDGEPLLVEMEGIERLFDGGSPQVRRVLRLAGAGAAAAPAGIRALARVGGELHALTGDLDRFDGDGRSLILEDHPNGRSAPSIHWRLAWPPEGDVVRAVEIRRLSDRTGAEGLAPTTAGAWLYLYDGPAARVTTE